MVTAAVVWTYWLAIVGLIVEGIFFAGLVWGYFHYVARPRYQLELWRAQLAADAAASRNPLSIPSAEQLAVPLANRPCR